MAPHSQAPSLSKGKGKVKEYFTWTPKMDKVLAECFIEQMKQGKSWMGNVRGRILPGQLLLMRLPTSYGLYWFLATPVLQSHGITQREELRSMMRMCGTNANPKLTPYRRKIIVENWEEICTIFSQDRANGQGGHTLREMNAEETVRESVNLGDPFETCEEDEIMRLMLGYQKRKEVASSSTSQGMNKKPSSSNIMILYLLILYSLRAADFANPKLAPYRSKIIVENWEEICTIFSQDRANGQGGHTLTEMNAEETVGESVNLGDPFETCEEDEIMRLMLGFQKRKEAASSSTFQDRANGQGGHTLREMNAEETVGESVNLGDPFETCEEDEIMRLMLGYQMRKEAASSSTSQGMNKKPSSSNIMCCFMKQIAENFGEFMVTERQILVATKKATPEDILEALKVVSLDEMQTFKALDLMMGNQRLYDTFVGLSTVEMKQQWLMV
ncbi:OLC1v1009398C1 [Oldenlandia corymbosa var. corymbosa]|uniref:OLC1v1009398C1 n=1 Tax=Oldenlandia corymbosa var. corymbosa TaxID=529605 RepID=A0AAV1DS55_OLDCO|nr:OLC1v1009398C1 [Oldenlandia corymbosa var. corymbosa]